MKTYKSNMLEDARVMTREQFVSTYGVNNAKYWDKLHHDNDYPDFDQYGSNDYSNE